MADLAHRLDTRTRLGDTESVSCKDLLVTLRMQLREALTEFKLLAIDRERAVSPLLTLDGVGGQTVCIYR